MSYYQKLPYIKKSRHLNKIFNFSARSCILIILATCLICVTLRWNVVNGENSTYKNRAINKHSNRLTSFSTTNQHRKMYILFWTGFFGVPNWRMPKSVMGKTYLESIGCPATNCIISHDRNLLLNVTDYDALVFHHGEPNDPLDLPGKRSENQIYVMANQETPFYSYFDKELNYDFFNMTMTYRLDSDVVWSYIRVLELETNVFVAPSKYAKWRQPDIVTDPQILEAANRKTKLAAWFASNCNAPSGRDRLVKELQKFISVDIYGKCGTFECPRDEMVKCVDAYKFYFAFENSLCVDYMTEKVFERMSSSFIIPVVFNGVANMSHFLPPHSYINVNDFKSMEELAKYLIYLDQNPQEYANYFWWKRHYTLANGIYSGQSYVECDLCVKMNEFERGEKRQVYMDMEKWFNHQTCKEPAKGTYRQLV